MVAAVGQRNFAFGLGAHRADHLGPQRTRPRRHDHAHAAGRRVHEHPVAVLHGIEPVQQVLGCHAAQQRGCGRFQREAGGQEQGAARRHVAHGRIGAGVYVGHRLADLEALHAGADRFDDACSLRAQHHRELRGAVRPVCALALVDIRVVEPDGVLNNAQLAWAGVGNLDVGVLEDFGAAMAAGEDSRTQQRAHQGALYI